MARVRGVLPSLPVACTTFDAKCIKHKSTNVQESCQSDWRIREAVLILAIPAIRASLVVLAMHVVLAVLEFSNQVAEDEDDVCDP